MFKRLFIITILALAVLAGFFGAQMGMDHDEPMSQACAAHCLDAALASHEAPVVSPEVFSGLGLLVMVVAGWALFPRVASVFVPIVWIQSRDFLQPVRSTVFRE